MSFRGDDSRRYGHVPPAQYPVAHSNQDAAQYPPRRPSFNNGDDAALFDRNQGYVGSSGRAEEELFISSPTSDGPGAQNRMSYQPQPLAMGGYQNQYPAQLPPPPAPPPLTTQSTYNPQSFARSQSTSLPYHPHPSSSRYSSPVSPTYNNTPTNYTPQAYNPAAYANTNTVPQRQATVAGYGSYTYGYNSPSIPQVSGFGQTTAANTYSPPLPSNPAGSPPLASYDPAMHGPSSFSPSAPSSTASQYDPSYSNYSNQQQQQYFPPYATNGTSSTTTPAYSTPQTSQASYPATTYAMPVGPMYAADPNSFNSRASRASSQVSPMPSPPSHPQPSSTLQRHPTNAPLPSRPMEDLPEEPVWGSGRREDDLGIDQDSLIQDIVSDLGVSNHGHRPQPINGNVSDDDLDKLRRYDSTASTVNSVPDSSVNRYASNASTVNRNNVATTYNWDDEESDPEGAAGLLAMQEDMDDRRFGFGGPAYPSYGELPAATTPRASQHPPAPEEQAGTDSDYGGMDLGMYGGGYAGNLQYGNETPPAPLQTHDGRPRATSNRGSDHPPFSEVSVDYGGTGGLQAPQSHRLSFDEGEEQVSLHSRQSGSDSPYKEDYPDMFWHPGLSSRPLPAIPPGSGTPTLSIQPPARGTQHHGYSLSADSPSTRQDVPEHYLSQHIAQQQVERSISLSSHSNTPPVQAPARSRTDAAEERRRAMKFGGHQHVPGNQPGTPYEGYDTGTPASLAAYDMITLPTGRRRKFIPSKLTPAEIKRCSEPWALSGITAWIREMAEGEPDLKKKTIEEGVLKLFCSKVPTMNVADAELLSAAVVESMFKAGILIPEEEWVKFGAGQMSGVLWQLTGSGCYAPKLHENEALTPRLHDNGMPLRCYSHHCGRTLKKANLDHMMSEEEKPTLDWATFHRLTMDDIQKKPKKEIERQNVLHEIVTGEEEYMGQLDVLRMLYRDRLRDWQPPIIAKNRIDKFLDAVFGKVDAVQQINKEHLLAQLKYRQQEQGPWIVGFSDLFREWIRKARPIYIEYCSSYPHASYIIRKESNRNLLFRQFLDMIREHPRSKRLEWTTFVKAPITRLQRYGLLLDTVKKNMIGDSEEKANLTKALEEIKAVTHECDEKVAEMTKKVELLELHSMLVLRPGFQSVLNLDHLGRELLRQGDLQRQGSRGVRWVDTHALLFDHYFILAKTVVSKDGRNDKKYDVSKEVRAHLHQTYASVANSGHSQFPCLSFSWKV